MSKQLTQWKLAITVRSIQPKYGSILGDNFPSDPSYTYPMEVNVRLSKVHLNPGPIILLNGQV